MKKQALIIVDHGSSVPFADDGLKRAVEMVKKLRPAMLVRFAHMAVIKPDIMEEIRNCVNDGADEIFVHPLMLSFGKHVLQDIPRLVKEAADAYPNIKIHITEPLGIDEKIAELILERSGL